MNQRSVRSTALALGILALAIYAGYIFWIGVHF
jgi:hypothetical protein